MDGGGERQTGRGAESVALAGDTGGIMSHSLGASLGASRLAPLARGAMPTGRARRKPRKRRQSGATRAAGAAAINGEGTARAPRRRVPFDQCLRWV